MRLYIAPLLFALGAHALVTPYSKQVSRDVSLQASNQPVSRRSAFVSSASAAAMIVFPTLPYAAVADDAVPAPKPPAPAPVPAPVPVAAPKPPAPAPASTSSASVVSVQEWPSLEYLEPIYEFKLAVDSFQAAAKDNAKWPYLKILLDKFFSGGLYSEKNYYSGLSFKYMQLIRYSETELKEFIKLDQNERYEAMEATMKHLNDLKDSLGKGNADKINADAEAARKSLSDWFALIPSSDVKAVEKLFRAVRLADKDRNGRLSEGELAALSDTDRNIWKKRVNNFGEA
uniref:Calmodulin n=1 Tax=Ditylum brightwellii TaxID=49249 RepID=A0A6U3NLH8_9STRA|mmetsp:Transcript_10381/g.15333  ORF Transcript_10381/g.15333 Transcript_10381/m.15333 type:complete len:287 (+) Transcript_10381:89-949(+)